MPRNQQRPNCFKRVTLMESDRKTIFFPNPIIVHLHFKQILWERESLDALSKLFHQNSSGCLEFLSFINDSESGLFRLIV